MARWPTIEARFWSKVAKSDGCWVWKSWTKQDGYPYGRFYCSLNGTRRTHLAGRRVDLGRRFQRKVVDLLRQMGENESGRKGVDCAVPPLTNTRLEVARMANTSSYQKAKGRR